MKPNLLFLTAILSTNIFSQVVVSPVKMNILYRGIENPIEVAVPGWENSDLIVSTSGPNELIKKDDGTYAIVPSLEKSRFSATINIQGQKPNGDIVDLGSKEFRVKKTPEPVSYWAGKTSTDEIITKNEIWSFAPIAAKMHNFDFEVKFKVNCFRLTITSDIGIFTFNSNSNRFTEEMKWHLMMHPSGTYIVIDQISATVKSKEVRLSDLALSIDFKDYVNIEKHIFRHSITQDGLTQVYDEDLDLIYKVNFDNGVLDGDLIDLRLRNYHFVHSFDNGILQKSLTYNPEGVLLEETHFDNWFDVKYKVYNRDGIIRYEGNYDQDSVAYINYNDMGDKLDCFNSKGQKAPCNHSGLISEKCYDDNGEQIDCYFGFQGTLYNWE